MREAFKEHLRYMLSRKPRAYERVISLRRQVNFEKLVFLNMVRGGDVVFDVGANDGYYTLLFSHLVGGRGQVHAFEPVPPTFEKLSSCIRLNKHFDNVYLRPLALGEQTGSARMYMPGTDDGQSSLAKHSFGSWAGASVVNAFDCQTITLDDYAAEQKVNRLEFLKCDIEGAELLALRGATNFIGATRPIIYLEICPGWTANFSYSPVDIINHLSHQGYASFYLVSDGLYQVHNPADELSAVSLNESANLLCSIPRLHDSRLAGLLRKYLSN